MSFQKGDVVQLKSGGPKMTVTKIGVHMEEQMVWCTWFEDTKVTEETFPPEALKPAS